MHTYVQLDCGRMRRRAAALSLSLARVSQHIVMHADETRDSTLRGTGLRLATHAHAQRPSLTTLRLQTINDVPLTRARQFSFIAGVVRTTPAHQYFRHSARSVSAGQHSAGRNLPPGHATNRMARSVLHVPHKPKRRATVSHAGPAEVRPGSAPTLQIAPADAKEGCRSLSLLCTLCTPATAESCMAIWIHLQATKSGVSQYAGMPLMISAGMRTQHMGQAKSAGEARGGRRCRGAAAGPRPCTPPSPCFEA